MTKFGDTMKECMRSFDESTANTRELKTKEKKKTTYKYTFEVSGIDMIAHYFVSGKEKMRLCLFLSQKNEDGKPVCFIQEKGQNLLVDEITLKQFLNGLSNKEQFPDGFVECKDENGNVCESVPRLMKANSKNTFIRIFLWMLRSENVLDYIKQGLINLDILHDYLYNEESRYYDRKVISIPWWISNGGYSRMSLDEMEYIFDSKDIYTNRNLALYKDNLHIKMFRIVINEIMEQTGKNKAEALRAFYSNETLSIDLAKKILTQDSFMPFIMLANRYDEPFAIQCMTDYMTNPKLDKFSSDTLRLVLQMDVGFYEQDHTPLNSRYSYNRVNTHSTFSLAKEPVPQRYENKILQLEKNRFWDYILLSSCVGLGKNLANYMQLWSDYLASCIMYYGKISDKYPEHLQEAHDIIIDKHSTYANFRKDSELYAATEKASKYCDMTVDGWTLHIFRSCKEFLDEANYQGNCLESADYAGKVARGDSWIASLRTKELDHPLVTVEMSASNGQIIQALGRFNHALTNEQREILRRMQDKIWDRMIKDGVLRDKPALSYAIN